MHLLRKCAEVISTRAVKVHIAEEHGSIFEYLLNMDKKYTGLTDVQKKLLDYFFKGINDKEIVELEDAGAFKDKQ